MTRATDDMVREKLAKWFNSTPHDMGKKEFDKLLKVVNSLVSQTAYCELTLTLTREELPGEDVWMSSVLAWNARWKRFEVVLGAHVITEAAEYSHWCHLQVPQQKRNIP